MVIIDNLLPVTNHAGYPVVHVFSVTDRLSEADWHEWGLPGGVGSR
jgi:hypothetical protein